MLAVVGGKGGCGKTTTAITLTRELASRISRLRTPLLVDADADMPDVHHYLGIDRTTSLRGKLTRTAPSGANAVSKGAPLTASVRYPEGLSGGAVLTAGTRDETARALHQCRRWPGPVIVDTPAGINPDVTGPLRIADHALVISTDEPVCLDDAKRTATVCDTLCQQSFGVIRRVRERTPRSDSVVCHETSTSISAQGSPNIVVPSRVGNAPVIGTLPTVSAPRSDEQYAAAIAALTATMTAGAGIFNPRGRKKRGRCRAGFEQE